MLPVDEGCRENGDFQGNPAWSRFGGVGQSKVSRNLSRILCPINRPLDTIRDMRTGYARVSTDDRRNRHSLRHSPINSLSQRFQANCLRRSWSVFQEV
jgi:hypothetical protein